MSKIKKALEEIIVSMIYLKPMPEVYCGLYLNEEAEMQWLVPVEVIEPNNGGYELVKLDPLLWQRDGLANVYKGKVQFTCNGERWGTVHGWFLALEDGTKFLIQRMHDGPMEIEHGDDIEIPVRLKL